MSQRLKSGVIITMANSSETQAYWKQILQKYFETQIANKRYISRLAWFLLFVLVAYSFFLLDNRPKVVPLDKAYLALGVAWLGFLPSIQYLFDHDRPPVPFFPLVGLFYATSFGLPIFASKAELLGRSSLANVTEEALFLVFLGILGMNIAFYISKYSLLRKVAPILFFRSYSLPKLLNLLRVLLLSHIAAVFIPFIGRIPSAPHILDPIGYVAYGMFYIIWSRDQLSSIPTKLLVIACFSLELIKRFATGALAQVALLVLFMCLVIWHERKRIPFVLISFLLFFFLIFNSIKGEYRALTWGGAYTKSSPIEQAQLFVEIAIKKYSGSDNTSQKKDNIGSSTDSTIERTAHIIIFSNIVDETPKLVPYWGGATYLPLFTSYVPRALWPEKPIENTGNVFGRRYRYIASNDFGTSINLPWIVEMYANFGNLGVLIGMPLVGLLLAFLDRKLNSPKMGSMQVVIGSTILFKLFYQELNFSLMMGGVISLVVALYIIFKYFMGIKPQQI
jgi:hypothetical protein